MSKAIITLEEMNADQINDWKEKHKSVFCIEVPNEAGDKKLAGYFRKPKIDELGMATAANKDNPLKATQVIYNTCFLGGHPDFEKDEDIKMAAMSKFGEIIQVREAEIKKL